ncbi:D-serine ammonia-lyase [Microvirga sp. ACRRW]|uniref:D-serine ammonia-lyase n=1 Tax=Microvirga sp. ACRRW TaxID=2918205 RepID=UPI001EF4FB84|nr:D-serine ammonia-lyase [Microvirga sp. ACRRW]MCG7393408.1 D-serine ammonia-lyase [Microvirga sp. ACRRW]
MPHSRYQNVKEFHGGEVPDQVRVSEPTVWFNPHLLPALRALEGNELQVSEVMEAADRWRRFAPLLSRLFPDVGEVEGRIDSPLLPLSSELSMRVTENLPQTVLVKADHALPLTGTIKARGGVYEVLVYAEELALRERIVGPGIGYSILADEAARSLFAQHTLLVGSTGNLGFSVGMIGRALGFNVEVHMSSDAKEWKKERLRRIGVQVVEHEADYSVAVAGARHSASKRGFCHFIDDENSRLLFFGYSAAALDLASQIKNAGIEVSERSPFAVFLPCGVGGAPGGVAFGLKAIFGDAVQCVFVEPVASPCMLVQLASGIERSVSVYDFGLDNKTAADGLAVPQASMLVARAMQPLVHAVATVSDDSLFFWVKTLFEEAGMKLEPSAASGFASVASYLRGLKAQGAQLPSACIVWTTGGSLLPVKEFEKILARAGM